MDTNTETQTKFDPAKYAKYVAKKNAEFAKMTKKEQRISIAKDVLAQIRAKRIIAQTGVYFQPARGYEHRTKRVDMQKPVAETLATVESCQACALGSLFACAADVVPSLKVVDTYVGQTLQNWTHDDSVRTTFRQQDTFKALTPFFSEAQLHMIECAFETAVVSGNIRRPQRGQCERFNEGISSPKTRLRRIMNNIIRNDGLFVPGDKFDAKKKGRARR